MKAVIDRFEEGKAVLLVGEKETQVILPKELLPEGAKEGDWLTLTMEIDPVGTALQKEKMTNLMEKLLNKKKS